MGYRSSGVGCGLALLIVACAFAAGGVGVLSFEEEIRESAGGHDAGRFVEDPQERQAVLRTVSWACFWFALVFAGGGLSNVMTAPGRTWDFADPSTRRRVVAGMATAAVLYAAALLLAQLLWPQTGVGFAFHCVFVAGMGLGAYRVHHHRGP
jgi:hypothetical protein